MAYEALDNTEINVDDAITQSLMQKIKDNFDFLYGASSGGDALDNPSFEIDSDSNGTPDNWIVSDYSGGSHSLDEANPAHGSRALKFTHPGGAGNGGGYATSAYVPCFEGTYDLTFLTWSSVHGLYNLAQVQYFDKDKITISADETVWDADGGQPLTPIEVSTTFTAPATARFYKIVLIGGYTSTDVAGAAFFDGLRVDPNTPTALAAVDNSEDVAMAQQTASSISWTQINTDLITLDVIDGGTGSTKITFTAQQATGDASWAASMRFRVGTAYSNEVTTNSETLVAKAMTLTIPNLTTSKITVVMEVKNVAVLLAYGYVGGYNDTTVELVP